MLANDPKYLIRVTDRFLQISVNNPGTNELQVNTMWLRDHCRCSICYNATTNQRSADITELKEKSAILKAAVATDPTPTLSIRWNDDHYSTYDLGWIKENWCNPRRPQFSKPILWSGEEMEKRGGLPTVSYSDLINGKNDAMKQLLKNVQVFGVGCVSGSPATFEETSQLCEMVALPEETVYERFWKFSAENMDHADTAYSTFALGAHTDLTYYAQTAGVQVSKSYSFS